MVMLVAYVSLCFLTYRLFFSLVNRQIYLFLCNFFYASRALPPPAIGYISIHIYFLLTLWLICIQLFTVPQEASSNVILPNISFVCTTCPTISLLPTGLFPGPLRHAALGAAHRVPQPEPRGLTAWMPHPGFECFEGRSDEQMKQGPSCLEVKGAAVRSSVRYQWRHRVGGSEWKLRVLFLSGIQKPAATFNVNWSNSRNHYSLGHPISFSYAFYSPLLMVLLDMYHLRGTFPRFPWEHARCK